MCEGSMLPTQPCPQPFSLLFLIQDVATGFCDGVFVADPEALTVVFPDPVAEVPTCSTTDHATMGLLPVCLSMNLLVPLTQINGFSN